MDLSCLRGAPKAWFKLVACEMKSIGRMWALGEIIRCDFDHNFYFCQHLDACKISHTADP